MVGKDESNPTAGLEDFVRVGTTQDFQAATVYRIIVDQAARALFHVDPTTDGSDPTCPFYATQPTCTHVSMCEITESGILNGKVVTCQTSYKPGCAHGSQFNVITGERLRGPAPANKALVRYDTKCVKDDVWVRRLPKA